MYKKKCPEFISERYLLVFHQRTKIKDNLNQVVFRVKALPLLPTSKFMISSTCSVLNHTCGTDYLVTK